MAGSEGEQDWRLRVSNLEGKRERSGHGSRQGFTCQRDFPSVPCLVNLVNCQVLQV